MVQATWRIAVGSMALGCLAIPMMQTYATVGAMYSLRRHVGPPENRIPIMSFRTQQIPILTTTAQVYVMEAFSRWTTKLFRDTSLDTRVRHGLAAVLKAVMVQHSQASAIAISDRCGAQGLFAHNQITSTFVSTGILIFPSHVFTKLLSSTGSDARDRHRRRRRVSTLNQYALLTLCQEVLTNAFYYQ